MGDFTPMTSGSIQMPGIMPASLMASMTSTMPFSPGKRVLDGIHSPTDGHQLPVSSYQPQSMTKISMPALPAASISGSSFSVVGSP